MENDDTTGTDKNRVTTLYKCYFYLFKAGLNLNNNLTKKEFRFIDTGEDKNNFMKIKYANPIDETLKTTNLVNLNRNEYSVYIGSNTQGFKKIFVLNLCFSRKVINKKIKLFIQYKNNEYNFNNMRNKLKAYEIQEHEDIKIIELINDTSISELMYYVNRHVFSIYIKEQFLNSYYNKNDLIYIILRKQLKIAHTKEKYKTMSSNFKNKCQNIPIDSCLNEKMCHIKEINPQEDCIDTNQIPFPKLCLPKNLLKADTREGCLDPTLDENKDIFDERKRLNLHNLITKDEFGFGSKWYNPFSKILLDIPKNFDEFCEMKFTTITDNKTYTINMVYDDDSSVNLINFKNVGKYNDTKSKHYRAQGTFVDNNFRKYEKEKNLIPLKIHGYCDLKIYIETKIIKDDIKSELSKYSSCDNVSILEGYYQYDLNAITHTEYLKKYYSQGPANSNTYILNSYKLKDTTKKNNYFFRMNEPMCNSQLLKGKFKLPERTSTQQSTFTKDDLVDTNIEETFVSGPKPRGRKILDFSKLRDKKNKQREINKVKKNLKKDFFFLTDEQLNMLLNLNLDIFNILSLFSQSELLYLFNLASDEDKLNFCL